MIEDFSAFEKHFDTLPDKIKEDYGKNYLTECINTVKEWKNGKHDPRLVTDSIISVLGCKYPASRYKIGYDAQSIFPTLALMPAFIQDCIFDLITPMPTPACNRY